MGKMDRESHRIDFDSSLGATEKKWVVSQVVTGL